MTAVAPKSRIAEQLLRTRKELAEEMFRTSYDVVGAGCGSPGQSKKGTPSERYRDFHQPAYSQPSPSARAAARGRAAAGGCLAIEW